MLHSIKQLRSRLRHWQGVEKKCVQRLERLDGDVQRENARLLRAIEAIQDLERDIEEEEEDRCRSGDMTARSS